MSFTPEERLEYWKKRSMDHIISCTGQVALDFKRIFADLSHAGFDMTEFNKSFAKISEGFSDFSKAIASAKKREEKKVEEVKTEETKVEEPEVDEKA